MSQFIGILIRRERLRQSYSQEGLCRGICAVSYLSKIEQGKAEAGADILLPLLKRLGIEYETDPAFLERADRTIEALYDELLTGRSDGAAFQKKLEQVREMKARYLASPYLLDALLLFAFQDDQLPGELEDFAACMTARQYALYLLLRMQTRKEDREEELLRLAPSSFYTCWVGQLRYWDGRYMEAASLLNRAYDLAAREGDVHLMFRAKLILGNCYSDSGQRELMLENYRVARKLAVILEDEGSWASTIDYNLGSTYLEWGLVEEAYELLQTVRHRDALYFHKLAIALEKLGRRDEALEALAQGYTQAAQAPKIVVMKMLDLVDYRLRHPDYLRDGIYARLMQETFQLICRTEPCGFARFHVPYMLEVLEAERRYKEAYQLSEKFSGLLHISAD